MEDFNQARKPLDSVSHEVVQSSADDSWKCSQPVHLQWKGYFFLPAVWLMFKQLEIIPAVAETPRMEISKVYEALCMNYFEEQSSPTARGSTDMFMAHLDTWGRSVTSWDCILFSYIQQYMQWKTAVQRRGEKCTCHYNCTLLWKSEEKILRCWKSKKIGWIIWCLQEGLCCNGRTVSVLQKKSSKSSSANMNLSRTMYKFWCTRGLFGMSRKWQISIKMRPVCESSLYMHWMRNYQGKRTRTTS